LQNIIYTIDLSPFLKLCL